MLYALYACCLGIYGFVVLSNDTTSFDVANNMREDSNETQLHQYLPLIGFNLMQFFTSMGLATIPNILMSEVFPFKCVRKSKIPFGFMYTYLPNLFLELSKNHLGQRPSLLDCP